jgi:hypothetical protein
VGDDFRLQNLLDSPLTGESSIVDMTITDAVDLTEFTDRFVRVWNEPDPSTRSQLIRLLWAGDAVEYTNANEYRGHEALEVRVANAHSQFVEEGDFVFRLATEPAAHHGSVLITVEMVPAAGGPPAWSGTVVAFLDAEGRIDREYQFGRNLPST